MLILAERALDIFRTIVFLLHDCMIYGYIVSIHGIRYCIKACTHTKSVISTPVMLIMRLVASGEGESVFAS